jgi:hypothetical protein
VGAFVQKVSAEAPKAQQLVLAASLAQSALAEHMRTVKVSGVVVLPQLRPGGFSVQVDWQLDVMAAVQNPAVPPLSTMVPQHTVPLPHSSVPLFPVQSSAWVVPVHEAAQVPVPVTPLEQQSSAEGHSMVPASAERHAGPVHTPAPAHATLQASVVVCQVPDALHVWGCKGPLHCMSPGAQTPVQVPLTQVLWLQAELTTQVPDALQVSGWLLLVHPVAPEAQTPAHTPPTHVEFVHGLPLSCQVPPELQFCGC